MLETGENLFRREALAAKRIRLEGEVLLIKPISAHAIIGILTLSMVGLVVLMTTGRYARTEQARGVLVTDLDLAKIVALRPGIVTRLAVAEGQLVRRGQLLASVNVDLQYAEGGSAIEEGLASLKEQQSIARNQVAVLHKRGTSERAALKAAVASAHAQSQNIRSQIENQRALVHSLESAFERYKPVAQKGYISQTQMDTREQQILTARQQLQQLQRQLLIADNTAQEASINTIKSTTEEESQKNLIYSTSKELDAKRSQLKIQRSYIITAPLDGYISNLQTGIGKAVDANLPLLTVVPRKARLHANLFVLSRAIGFLRAGQEVRLLYDAFPYQRFGSFKGTVAAVSRTAIDGRQVDAPFRIEEPVYKVSVIPHDQEMRDNENKALLRPGMTLTANIVLERQTFLQWLLQPLNSTLIRS